MDTTIVCMTETLSYILQLNYVNLTYIVSDALNCFHILLYLLSKQHLMESLYTCSNPYLTIESVLFP